MRNATQSLERCVKHALGPTVTLSYAQGNMDLRQEALDTAGQKVELAQSCSLKAPLLFVSRRQRADVVLCLHVVDHTLALMARSASSSSSSSSMRAWRERKGFQWDGSKNNSLFSLNFYLCQEVCLTCMWPGAMRSSPYTPVVKASQRLHGAQSPT
ncbi:hypothetical protein EYF80_034848 [Liparis tanakae]|uniref:Uncharacterized protein n=1 Tax=Liparis tanakae TaxID=230148 RepID=A0A4Z2GQ54_9TELE|nr:hypothetical protein EYF80_034848 [Liparis tanakae]